MKLSEILKDWPVKQNKEHISAGYGPLYEEMNAKINGFNTALTSCDREIDRDALASILYSFKSGHGLHSYTDIEKLMLIEESYRELDHIISTMPQWLKRTDNGKI